MLTESRHVIVLFVPVVVDWRGHFWTGYFPGNSGGDENITSFRVLEILFVHEVLLFARAPC